MDSLKLQALQMAGSEFQLISTISFLIVEAFFLASEAEYLPMSLPLSSSSLISLCNSMASLQMGYFYLMSEHIALQSLASNLSTLNPAAKSRPRLRISFNMSDMIVASAKLILIQFEYLALVNSYNIQFPMIKPSDSYGTLQLQKLLQDVKLFLARNNKVEGAFELLVRLDAYLQSVTQTQSLYRKISQQSSSMKDEGQIQIVLDSDEQTKQSKVIEPRKFANLLDMFILEYSFTTKAYQILSFYPIDSNSEIENDRKAVSGLILCPMKDHCVEKQKTNSMTQLHKLTSNIPQNNPALILPNYSNEPSKYINIFEAKECIENQGKYYLVDRYYCFITDGLSSESLDALFRQFKSRVFEERVLKVEQPSEVNCKTIRESLLSVLPYLVDKANQLPLTLHEPPQVPWVEKQLDFKIRSTKTTVNCSLLLFVTYLAICEFKVILVSSKNMKHRLSDLILSLQGSLKPMKYAYPVVFCSLSRDHCDFVESPVPLIIGYWGSDNRKQKFVKQFQQYLTQHQNKNATPSIVIDLENCCVTNQTGLANQDIFALQKINKHIKKYAKPNCLWLRISQFMKRMAQNIEINKKQDKEWMKIFKQKLKNSQMFNIHLGI